MKYIKTERKLPYPIPIKKIAQSTQFLINFYDDMNILEKYENDFIFIKNYYLYFLSIETFSFMTDINIIHGKEIGMENVINILTKVDYIKKLKIKMDKDDYLPIIIKKSDDIEELTIDFIGLKYFMDHGPKFRNLKKLTIFTSRGPLLLSQMEKFELFFDGFAPNMRILINNSENTDIHINQNKYKNLHSVLRSEGLIFMSYFYFTGTNNSNITNINIQIIKSETTFPLVKTWKSNKISSDFEFLRYFPELQNLYLTSSQLFDIKDHLIFNSVTYFKLCDDLCSGNRMNPILFRKLKLFFPELKTLDLSGVKYWITDDPTGEKIENDYPELLEEVILDPRDNVGYFCGYIYGYVFQTNTKYIYNSKKELLVEINNRTIIFKSLHFTYLNMQYIKSEISKIIFNFQHKYDIEEILSDEGKKLVVVGKNENIEKIDFLNFRYRNKHVNYELINDKYSSIGVQMEKIRNAQ